MDVHKPEPWHGVQEFLKEYAIVVLGVLTALAGDVPLIRKMAADLGVGPERIEKLSPELEASRAALCKSIFPA